MYFEALDHGVYRILVTNEDGIPYVLESCHVTFDETKFPGPPSLADFMENEADSDDTIVSGENEPEGASDSEGPVAIALNETTVVSKVSHNEIDDDMRNSDDDDIESFTALQE